MLADLPGENLPRGLRRRRLALYALLAAAAVVKGGYLIQSLAPHGGADRIAVGARGQVAMVNVAGMTYRGP